MANMNEIARMAGVSLGTVSHVLNGSARVREPLRERVEQAVKKLGYQASALARGLRRETTNIIGMIIPDVIAPPGEGTGQRGNSTIRPVKARQRRKWGASIQHQGTLRS